jgi:trimethylamine:corrinoid methyltransferase-like protein
MGDDGQSSSKRRSRRDRLAAKSAEVAAPDTVAPAEFDVAMPKPLPAGGPAARPSFAYLDDARVDEFVDRGYRLLEEHGIHVSHAAAAAKLGAAGCKLEADGKLVRIPRKLAEEATGTGAHGFIEPDGTWRKLVLDDVRTIAAIGDGLPEVGFIAHPFVNGVPERTSDIHGLAAMLANSEKHNWIQPYDVLNVGFLLEMAAVAAGGEDALRARPIVSCIACSFTPFEFKEMDIEAIIQCGRHGVPIHACSLPTAGGTAPVTMPGTVLMATAEILAMVTLTHILAPGTPLIATPLIFALDMRTGRSLQASVEALSGAAMAVQVCKRGFGLMTHTYGSGADTPDLGGQSMAERALIGFVAGQSGADVLGGVGQLECATVFSPIQAIIDSELGAMQKAWMRTPEVNDETLAWDLMMDVPQGGHFLANEHTLKHCRGRGCGGRDKPDRDCRRQGDTGLKGARA